MSHDEVRQHLLAGHSIHFAGDTLWASGSGPVWYGCDSGCCDDKCDTLDEFLDGVFQFDDAVADPA